jgi:proteasome component ECM29
LFSESENGEDGHVPLEKIMECVKSCIQVATIDDILSAKADLIHVLIISLSPGFLWTVKMSGISCVGKLCSRFPSLWTDSMDDLSPSDATKFVHELFHSLVPKLLECIHTVKIAQVCFSLVCIQSTTPNENRNKFRDFGISFLTEQIIRGHK